MRSSSEKANQHYQHIKHRNLRDAWIKVNARENVTSHFLFVNFSISLVLALLTY